MKIKIPHLKLRTKFILAIIIVVAIFGTLNIYFNKQSTYESLRKELDKRCLFLANTLAEKSVKLLLYEDVIALQELFEQTLKSDSDISYIFIIDKQGNIVAHTFGSTFPLELLKANKIKNREAYHFQLIQDENNHLYRDVAVPILQQKLGFLRLGIAEKSITQATSRVVVVLTGMVIFFLFLGIIGAVVFAYWITTPISKITRAFETIDLNKKFEPLTIKTKDEINVLANKFNEMATRLQRAHYDLKIAQRGLIQSEKLASVGTLASGLTHEISSPLAGLKNCLLRIRRNPSRSEMNRYFNLMMKAIEKIEKVVGGLLNFARRDDFNFRPFNLNETINRALSLLDYKLEKSRVRVEKKLDDNLGKCRGDSHYIEQVIVNLILNAIDAMPQGGKLSIKTSANNSIVALEVKDTGIGIPPEKINKIFDPFFTTKEPGKGTGLGLAVSYNIVKEHGGKIIVESEVNKGTKFTIFLPLNTISS